MKTYQVDILENITAEAFKEKYLEQQKPMLLKGGCKNWQATKKWGLDYFQEHFAKTQVPVKRFENDEIIKEQELLGEYCQQLRAYEENPGGQFPSYCHDIPIFNSEPALKDDICDFPVEFLPEIYKNWWQYCQFFLGPAGSVTPLHFDCLLTHNLFFQIRGTKRFTLMPYSEAENCGQHNWRWFKLDPEQIDERAFSDYNRANTQVVDVEAGDILFMPGGTLHHVRSLDTCISFNIDFHDISSAWQGVEAVNKGIPEENFYYNSLTLMRLLNRAPESVFFKYYKSYLNYVS
ncbi:cupin-like domain-containing protein [Thalassomonas viridans]|uniref:Cupin-like domain-containing protein n=1 Tax=Thalassomonas viridans TaxID=137584 RepID=A0AAE9Z3C1_9GAMM|nr:cupin-like domain-containing protein [Thalassomonas viridans]WDE05299.1 cupin-like domain-containing protein [Thalassomonas viridans]